MKRRSRVKRTQEKEKNDVFLAKRNDKHLTKGPIWQRQKGITSHNGRPKNVYCTRAPPKKQHYSVLSPPYPYVRSEEKAFKTSSFSPEERYGRPITPTTVFWQVRWGPSKNGNRQRPRAKKSPFSKDGMSTSRRVTVRYTIDRCQSPFLRRKYVNE